MTKENIHKMVGYQIYPKSFMDANGDGVGDLEGIIAKIPYLAGLGVDFIWLNPIYQSPQFDGGYDISDFYAIDAMFGTMADFRRLLDVAHAAGLRVIMDLVVNHTSDTHPWFVNARKSRDSKYRDYYLWADATAEAMPNDWQSFFGGPTWTYDAATSQAYFHVFSPQQPDLNWRNPALRQEIYQMIRWWLELGIDGFRLDAISHIQKAPWDTKIRSHKGNGPWQPFMNVAGIEDYMAELKAIFDAYGALTVGEASGVTSGEASRWAADDATGYIDMIFELEHRVVRPDGAINLYGYKKKIIEWQRAMQSGGGWQALYLENHDGPRSISLYGDGTMASAAALAVSYMLLRGTPFIYQGQELGMTNYPYRSRDELDATESKLAYDREVATGATPAEALAVVTKNSRDHSRTPMQWDATAQAGFTTGQSWLPINPNHTTVNAAFAADGLTALYQRLIALRHASTDIADGPIDFLFESHPTAFAYRRGSYLVLTNLGQRHAHLDLSEQAQSGWRWVLGSRERPLTPKLTLDAWEYQIYQEII